MFFFYQTKGGGKTRRLSLEYFHLCRLHPLVFEKCLAVYDARSLKTPTCISVETLGVVVCKQAIARNLHHLVSTKSISGVFNSPYMRLSGRVPTIRGVEVEQHLTISAKDLLR